MAWRSLDLVGRERRRAVGGVVGHLGVRQTGSSSPRRGVGFQPADGWIWGKSTGVVLSAESWDTWGFDKLEVRRHVVGWVFSLPGI